MLAQRLSTCKPAQRLPSILNQPPWYPTQMNVRLRRRHMKAEYPAIDTSHFMICHNFLRSVPMKLEYRVASIRYLIFANKLKFRTQCIATNFVDVSKSQGRSAKPCGTVRSWPVAACRDRHQWLFSAWHTLIVKNVQT